MAPNNSRCLVRGSINVDEFFFLPHIVRPGETISSTSYAKKPGGKGANQAYATAQAGGKVDLNGFIGSDGLWVRSYLANGGVGVERIMVVENEVTGRAIIQGSADGGNSIVLHKGANFHVPSTTSSPDLASYSHLVLQNEVPLSETMSYLEAAGGSSLTTMFNPSPMLTPDELRSFPWKRLTWLIVNEGELADLAVAFDATPENVENDLRIRTKMEILALHECQHFDRDVSVICTLGAEGILYYQPGRDVQWLAAASLRNPLKDTTGAGDCFAGYFAAGLMELGAQAGEGSLKQVLQTCLTACAICVENAGAMESVPTRAQVNARMNA